MSNRKAALALVNRGFRIFPCRPDKTPKVNAWETNASTHIGLKWEASPEALIGLPCFVNGLVVVDCDVKDGKQGIKAFKELCAKHSIELSNAYVVETPSSGLHFYFKANEPFANSAGQLAPGIDIRGKGGYVIAEGSTLPDGSCYKRVSESAEIPPLPDALAALLKRKDVSEAHSLPIPATAHPEPTERDRIHAQSALKDECKLVAEAQPGTRNDTLNRAAFAMGTLVGNGSLEYEHAANALWEATALNGTFDWPDGKVTATGTIKSGLNAGMLKPRDLLQPDPIMFDAQKYQAQTQAAPSAQLPNDEALINFLDGIKPFRTYNVPPVKYLIPGFLPEGCITMFSGGAGSGKSSLVMKLTDEISNGKPLFGWQQAARKVLYLDRENPPGVVDERFNRMRIGYGDNFKYFGGHLGIDIPKRIFSMPGFKQWLNRDSVKPIVVVDSQIAFQEGKETDSNDVRAFYQPLRDLTFQGITVIVIHHTGKGESTKEFRGSEDIRAAVDVGYTVNNATKGVLSKLTLSAFKCRIKIEEELAFNYVDGEFIPQNLKAAKDELLTMILRNHPGINKTEFRKLAMDKQISRDKADNFIETGIGFGTVLTRKGESNANLLYLPESIPLAQSQY